MKEKLIEILSIQSSSYEQFRMFAYIIRKVKEAGCSYYVNDGNIYATKGHSDYYPCVVAHMDTVHSIVEDLTVLEVDEMLFGFNKVKMEQAGIGGDDKVGVFVALQCLEDVDNIKVAFFRDEEVGCHGSYGADVNFFSDCRFVLQCDRRGYGDFVTNASGTELSSKDFQDAVYPILKDYEYKFTSGMMTDVMALKEIGIDCSMANISCSYYNPHMSNEYVDYVGVQLVTNMVLEIIYNCQDVYYHKAEHVGYNWRATGPQVSDKDFWGNSYKDKFDVTSEEWCEDCGNMSKDLTYVKEYNIMACYRCYQAYRVEGLLS